MNFLTNMGTDRRRLLLAGLLLALLLLIPGTALAQAPVPDAAPQPRISDYLARQLAETDGPVSFLAILADQLDVDATLAAAGIDDEDGDPVKRGQVLYAALTDHATATQADLRAFLDEQSAPYRPYYIVNMLEVEGDAQLAADLLAREDVGRLVANPDIPQSLFEADDFSGAPPALDYGWARVMSFPAAEATLPMPWGLGYTNADDVWDLGYTGQGVVIASQDTGVEWTHPALQPRYRGYDAGTGSADHVYNWFDAWGTLDRPARCDPDPQVPCDDYGHGTHTVGTVLGNAQGTQPRIGVAPDAFWMGCRNMHDGLGAPGAYTACFEFFLAPYPQGGDSFTDGKPEKAPNIINNSWGCPPDEGCDADSLQQVVETARAAGQFVIASAGNYGCRDCCASVRDPIAIYDAVFSVGAHNSGGSLASFSSRGPVTVDGSGRLKPDIAAPGVGVYSAWVGDGYQMIQGTSMASPHVVGAAALLWSAQPDLMGRIDRSEQLLIKSATPVTTTVCGGETSVPNNLFGYGRLDALQAVEMALNPSTVTVTVTTETRNGQPFSGAQVIMQDKLTGYRYAATASKEGVAVFMPIYAGAYAVGVLPDNADPDGPVDELASVEIKLEDEAVAVEITLPMLSFYLPIVAR
jgi:subtilisin family serine protease